MPIPSHAADLHAAADALRDAALTADPDTTAVPIPRNAVHAIANWFDDAATDAEAAGGADPLALIAALQILHPTLALASGADDSREAGQ